jgi:hypothetical protein
MEEHSMADLSGDLESFALEAVLELLADAGKDGELQVRSDRLAGRILLTDGRVAYATTASGSDTVEELDALLERYQADMLASDLPTTLEEVLEEQLTEVAYSLMELESGSFEFIGSDAPGPDDVHTVPVADLMDMVVMRAENWRTIRRVIPTNDGPYRLTSQLPAERSDVTLTAPQWAMLAAVGAGASVAEVATALNLYEFHTAGAFADLVGEGLLESVDEPVYRAPVEEIEEPEVPRLLPADEPVTFSTQDLSSDEINEVIRNMGRGIFPG